MILKAVLFAACVIAAAHAQTGPCVGPEAYRQSDGRDYRGFVNTTISGIPCQKWSSQTPHGHGTIVPDVINGIGDDNYCRNPTGASFAGCYTMDINVRFERCDIGRPCTTPITRPPNSVSFSPSSGAEIEDGMSITLTCLPKPCEMFYTLDGSEPTIQSTRYTRPVGTPASLGPFLLKSLTVFNDGTQAIERANYIKRAAVVTTVANLYPPATVVYPKPVLVSVLTTDPSVPIFIFLQNDAIPREYNGPFWVYATTAVTAVVGDNVLSSTYVVETSPRLPAFYPTSGTFYGSLQVVFIPTVSREEFYVRINGKNWERIESNSLTISSVGKTTLEVQSISVDFPASAIESAIYTIAPTSPPKCSPESGTYSSDVLVSCTIGNSSVPVEQLCISLEKDTQMQCTDTSQITLDAPGVYVVSATYYDAKFNPQLSMYTYNMVPRQLDKATVVPCGGNFMDELIVDSRSNDNVSFSFRSVGTTSSVKQIGASTALVTLVADRPALAVYDVFIASFKAMESAPLEPKTCITALYPLGAETLQTQWMRIPKALWTSSSNLTTRVANALRCANASLVEVQLIFDSYLLVRATPHRELCRSYTHRLYRVLEDMSASVGGGVSTETGVIPADELRQVPADQSITAEEIKCAAQCGPGARFVLPCNCTHEDATSASEVSQTFGVIVSFRAITPSPTVASAVDIRFDWLGTSRNVTAKAVLKKFGCGDLGYPLAFKSRDTATFTPRHAKHFVMCVDDGNGFHEIGSTDPLVVTMAEVAKTPSLYPCGGTFSTAIEINVTGILRSSKYSIDGGSWKPLTKQIKLPIQSYGMRNVISVVSEYVDPLTGVTTLSDSFVCVYRFGTTPSDMGALTYTFERTGDLSVDTHSKLEEARVRINVANTKGVPISVFVSNTTVCDNAPFSYGVVQQVGPAVSQQWASDAGFLLAASKNETERFTVCASQNTDPSRKVVVQPSSVAISPLALLINATCGDRCGPGRVCIAESLCGCVAKNGSLSLCGAAPVEVRSDSAMGIIVIAMLALVVPVLLGVLLFVGIRKYGSRQPV